jgi:hypothetical protein
MLSNYLRHKESRVYDHPREYAFPRACVYVCARIPTDVCSVFSCVLSRACLCMFLSRWMRFINYIMLSKLILPHHPHTITACACARNKPCACARMPLPSPACARVHVGCPIRDSLPRVCACMYARFGIAGGVGMKR